MSQKSGALAPSKHFQELGLSWQSYPSFFERPEADRIKMARKLTNLTGQGFMRDKVDEELAKDVEEHVAEAPRLFVLNNNSDEPQAYISAAISEWCGYSVYELWGIIVNPLLQGKRLGFSMVLAEIVDARSELIILRTQNMSMYKLAAAVSFLSDDLARAMAPKYYPDNLDGCINRGVYQNGGSLYGDQVQFESQAIPSINWRAGDGLVIAGFIRKEYQQA